MSDAGGSLSPLDYHQATKHAFNRFARSLGYLDWASQPSPFRRFAGAQLRPLPREAWASGIPYESLFFDQLEPAPISRATVGEFLRCSLGLSAWKVAGAARWALRVNPSSGNLHPTEGYVVWNGAVCHYAPAEHALEERAAISPEAWPGSQDSFLVALTSIHWREAWKYGERAFRYCQHDVGHALGALRLAAAMLGWRLTMLPGWSHAEIAAVLGLDRDEDFRDAEREEPDLIALVSASGANLPADPDPQAFLSAFREAKWAGRANRLSSQHVDWPLIDAVATGTAYPGVSRTAKPPTPLTPEATVHATPDARQIILQRRSATAFDPRGVLRRDVFLSMLQRLTSDRPPWDALWWTPQVSLALFVHRVQDVVPGIYFFVRSGGQSSAEWRAAMRSEFLWEGVAGTGPGDADGLFLLAPLDVRHLGNRVSCDQDIAGDGFFSLGMIADLSGLQERGPWFYRHLFWECGVIGQVLYLEAEAAGARATGIGCYYDDPVHQTLGLTDQSRQSLYHFSMGLPVDDTRLTTQPGYEWEALHDL